MYESSRITNLPNHMYNLTLNGNSNGTTSSAGSSSGYDSSTISNHHHQAPVTVVHHNYNQNTTTTVNSGNNGFYNPYTNGSISRNHNSGINTSGSSSSGSNSNTNTISSGTNGKYIGADDGSMYNQMNSDEMGRLMNEALVSFFFKSEICLNIYLNYI